MLLTCSVSEASIVIVLSSAGASAAPPVKAVRRWEKWGASNSNTTSRKTEADSIRIYQDSLTNEKKESPYSVDKVLQIIFKFARAAFVDCGLFRLDYHPHISAGWASPYVHRCALLVPGRLIHLHQ